jgi:putative FmdB family regulatory protein
MPIYAYRCSTCGHAKDVLQKISDPLLTTCPACGGETFSKQLTAAGFQLKGSGWYVTDFRGGNSTGSATSSEDKPTADSSTGTASSEPSTSAAAAPASSESASSFTSSGGCGTACACH